MDTLIRAFDKEDWDEVAAIYREGIETKIATFRQTVPTYEEWDSFHTKEYRLVAESKGQVVGWAALSPYSRRIVYSGVAEASVYVKKEFRNHKIGEKLLRELIRRTEQAGYWTLQSSILAINEASIALHKKVGFHIVGYREKLAKDSNGVWQDTVLMERRSREHHLN